MPDPNNAYEHNQWFLKSDFHLPKKKKKKMPLKMMKMHFISA